MSQVKRLYAPPEIGAPGRQAARRRRRELRRAGLFVAAMLLLLLLAALFLSWHGLDSRLLHTEFSSAEGVRVGTPVEQAGYGIGAVVGVKPEIRSGACGIGEVFNAPCFHVTLRLRKGWPIARDSRALIGSKLLQGGVIRIEPGRSGELLAAGDAIPSGGREPDISSDVGGMLGQVSELIVYLRTLVDETVRPILASVNKQVEALQGLLVAGQGDTGKTLNDVSGIVANLNRITADLAAQVKAVGSQDISGILGSARRSAVNIEAVTAALKARSKDIQQAVRDYRRLAGDLRKVIQSNSPSIQRTLNDTQYMTQELATALTPIMNNIDETTRNLLELSRDLRDNPAVLLGGRQTRDNAPE